jgi:hypothetical protein
MKVVKKVKWNLTLFAIILFGWLERKERDKRLKERFLRI